MIESHASGGCGKRLRAKFFEPQFHGVFLGAVVLLAADPILRGVAGAKELFHPVFVFILLARPPSSSNGAC
jgi:hypothetical protein